MHSYELRRGELFQGSTHAPASAELRRAVLIFTYILTFTIKITKILGCFPLPLMFFIFVLGFNLLWCTGLNFRNHLVKNKKF